MDVTFGVWARFVDPEDVDAIAAALRELAADEGLRARLVAAGRARVATFSWRAMAERTREVYREALR